LTPAGQRNFAAWAGKFCYLPRKILLPAQKKKQAIPEAFGGGVKRQVSSVKCDAISIFYIFQSKAHKMLLHIKI